MPTLTTSSAATVPPRAAAAASVIANREMRLFHIASSARDRLGFLVCNSDDGRQLRPVEACPKKP
jgi:hypothetical protein